MFSRGVGWGGYIGTVCLCQGVGRGGQVEWAVIPLSVGGAGWGREDWGRASLLVAGGYDGLRLVWKGAPSSQGVSGDSPERLTF